MKDAFDCSDGQLLSYVGHAYRTVAEACMHSIGLRRTQVMLLMQIFKQDGLTQIELAERLTLNGATVSEMLQRLEEMGLIVRERDPHDRRLVHVSMTEEGHETVLRIQQRLQALEQRIFAGVHTDERLMLRPLLHQILYNMRAAPAGEECVR